VRCLRETPTPADIHSPSSISATDDVALKKLGESLRLPDREYDMGIQSPTLISVGDGKSCEPSVDICTGDELVLADGRRVRYKGLATLRIAIEKLGG